jgi:hypothetical protein
MKGLGRPQGATTCVHRCTPPAFGEMPLRASGESTECSWRIAVCEFGRTHRTHFGFQAVADLGVPHRVHIANCRFLHRSWSPTRASESGSVPERGPTRVRWHSGALPKNSPDCPNRPRAGWLAGGGQDHFFNGRLLTRLTPHGFVRQPPGLPNKRLRRAMGADVQPITVELLSPCHDCGVAESII